MAHLEAEHNLFYQKVVSEENEYNSTEGPYIAICMETIEEYLLKMTKSETCMSQQYLLEKGLKIFGKKRL